MRLPCAEQAVAFLAKDTNGLARSLVALKGVFPSADVAGMVVRQPALLMERSAEQLAATAEQLRQLLPDFDTNWWEALCVRRIMMISTAGGNIAFGQQYRSMCMCTQLTASMCMQQRCVITASKFATPPQRQHSDNHCSDEGLGRVQPPATGAPAHIRMGYDCVQQQIGFLPKNVATTTALSSGCRLVEQHPQIALDVETFGETLAEAQRMMPNADIGRALRTNPSMIFGFERRSSMIPYDS